MRVASIDLKKIERLRETGDYQRLRALLPDYRKSADLYDETTVVVRIAAAEIAASECNTSAMRDALEPYLDRLKSVPFDLVCRVMILGALYYSLSGLTDEATALITIAGDIASAREDEVLLADALHCEGEILYAAGRLEDAEQKLDTARSDYLTQARSYRLGISCLRLGEILTRLGKIEKAVAQLKIAMAVFTNRRDTLELSAGRCALADLLIAAGQHSHAIDLLQKARAGLKKAGRWERVRAIEARMAEVFLLMKQYEKARGLRDAALMIEPVDNSGATLAKFHEVQARLYCSSNDLSNGEVSAVKAIQLAASAGNLLATVEARRTLGRVYLAQERNNEASVELTRALEEIKQAPSLFVELEIKALLAQAIYATRPKEAKGLISEVEQKINGCPFPLIHEACAEARKRLAKASRESFFILSDRALPTLSEARKGLMTWLIRRAMWRVEGSPEKAASLLKVTGTYVRRLLKENGIETTPGDQRRRK